MSRIRLFIDWWLTGLLLLLPEQAREKIRPTPNKLLITLDEQGFVFQYINSHDQRLLEERRFNKSDELGRGNIVNWLTHLQEDNIQFILQLPKKKVLNKTISLPLNAENNLEEILSFEMDRQTPFSAAQVYFDQEIISHDIDREKLQLSLFVVLKKHLDPILEEIRTLQVQVHVVVVEGHNSDINLLPAEQIPPPQRQFSPLTSIAATGCILVFFVMLYVPFFQQGRTIEQLETTLKQTRAEAKQAQALLEEKEGILARTQFLSEKRKEQIPVIDIIKELTHILPDDTYLNRLIIRKDEIQLHGESNTATALIQSLENPDVFANARFRSPVTKNNVSQRDKFHVSVNIVDKESGNASN